MANIYSVAIQAIDAYKRLNDAASYVLPEDIEKIVKKHAAIAATDKNNQNVKQRILQESVSL